MKLLPGRGALGALLLVLAIPAVFLGAASLGGGLPSGVGCPLGGSPAR